MKTPYDVVFHLTQPGSMAPRRSTGEAACYDFYATSYEEIQPGQQAKVSTGVKVDMPPGLCLLMFSRSGHGFNFGVRLSNCVGVIDSDYTGEIGASIRNDGDAPFVVNVGDRIAQGLFVPVLEFNSVRVTTEEMNKKTERGEGGFGSTGR